MDEDVIVREIVKSLAFEIEATNEDNVLKWTSTNGTPLSVKVRVRNPDEPRLVQKGPFPIPRIGIKAPDRLRLVSSDQTILSFNIYLDKEAQKQEEYKRSKLFQIFNIGGCLGTINDDDGPYLPSSSNQKAITHKSSSRSESAIIDTPHTVPPDNESKKWPFGRCKPGGCLDPPFGEDKYHYAPSKADRRTKLALEIRELEKKEGAECVDSTLTEKSHLKAGSKENYQQKLDSARHEVEPKKEIDVLCGASEESRRKSKQGSLQCRSSFQISIKDEVDSIKLTDIYPRKSRENSLVTYHIDTSSTESLYGPIPNPSIKSYNESQKQTYEYPESYFVPPKDVLRYKEEERRYSKDPSNYQIGVSGLPKENNTTDKIITAKAVAVEHKPISQNARGSKDVNMKKLKVTLTKLQSNNVDVAQKIFEDNISSTRLASDSKELISYIPTDSTNIDDYRNVPDTRTENDFKTTAKNSMREKEDFNIKKPKKLRSGNDDIANIEVNSNMPLKESTNEKPDGIILSNDKISKPFKLQASTLTDSNVDEFSEVVKTNGRTFDKSHVLYPNNQSLNDQISANDKGKDIDITDKSNLIKAGMVDHKPITQNARQSTDINMQKIETKSAELQPNNIDFAQKGCKGKASPTRLASDSKEPVFYILTDSNNVDDHKNLPDKILRSENVDIANKEDNTDIPIKVRKTEKLDGVVLSRDETYKPIKSLSDCNMLPSSNTTNSYSEKKITKDKPHKKPSLPESRSNVVKVPSSSCQDVSNVSSKADQTLPEANLVVDPDQQTTNKQTASKQNYESIKQLDLNKVSNRQPISGYKNVEETVKNNDAQTTLYEKSRKQSQITKDKQNLKANERDDYATLNKLYPQVQQHETNVQNEKSKNLTPSRKSSYENKEFDVSSTHSIDFMPKHLSNNELNDEVDTLPKKQPSAILQKTPFIPRHDMDIHDNDIDKSTQLKRQTFTIIGSDTSLPKQEEIEETPKDATNIYSKATDNAKSVSPRQIQDKTNILDARSKKLNTKTQSNASVEPPYKTTQENVNKTIFQITDKHKSGFQDQTHNKAETLNKSDKAPGNIRDLILSGHQTDNLARTQENNKDMPGNINDLRSIITSDRHGLLGNQNRDESDTKKREGSKEYNNKYDDVATGSLLDKPIPDLYSKDTDYDRASPSSQVSGKAETLSTNNKDLEKTPEGDSAIESLISQKHLQESTIPQKFAGNVKSALSPEYRDNAEVISSDRNTVRITEIDKFSLTSKNHDKTENVIKTPENLIFKEIITDSHESLPENLSHLHSKVTSDDMSIPVFPIINESGLSVSYDRFERTRERDGSSENVVQENVRDLYAHITDDGKLTQYMQNRDKSESLSRTSKLMENKTYSSPPRDTSKKFIPQNQNILYSADIDHDDLATVLPKRDGTEHLVNSYKEQEDKMKLEDVKYKDIDGKKITELGVNSSPKLVPKIIPNIDEVTDDAKYIAFDKFETGFTGTGSNQPQINIPKENLKQFDVSDYYDNIKAPDEIEFTENLADRYSKLSNKPKSVSEKSPPDSEYLGLISEVLSNISVKTEEEERFTKPSIGRDTTLGRDRDLIQTNTGVNQDNELLGDKFSHMTIPTMPITHVSNIDRVPKLDNNVYNVSKNTLENPSISTFEIKRDSINKTVTEAFDYVEHMIDDSDQVKQQSNDYRKIIKKLIIIDSDLPFTNESDISEKPTDYRSSKVPISVIDNIYRNREDFDTKPSVYIRGEEQNERTSPSLQVIKESGSQNYISYLDMSFYSYINDDNQRVVQTYSPPKEQQRGNDATVTVVKTLIRHGNEVRIPVDKENDLTLNIVDKHSRVCDAGSSIGSPTRYPHREHHIVDHAKNQDVLTKNLALIYESGLIPLHNVIKDLTQQVNNLTAKQEILQELKSSAKRTKSLRLIPVVKSCGCKRRD